MKNVVAVILGGGQGTRLYPLTKNRAKPSVPIAGKFRLIDIPMSNSIHSELEKIFILTQFNSASLNRHIGQTYQFGSLSNKSVRILAAQQTYTSNDWYQGTADAVRQNLSYLVTSKNQTEHVLILAGDHLYRMDYRRLIGYHLLQDADITVGAIPVYREQTSDLGILKAEPEGRITHFVEKPQTDEELAELSVDLTAWSDSIPDAASKPYLASMGIYVFKKEILIEKLEDKSNVDFGRHILPRSIYQSAVYAYPFGGYWEDIGTIKSFYQANLELLDPLPRFDFYNESAPVYTYQYHLPSTKVNQSNIYACMLAEGSIIDRSELNRSIIGLRGIVRSDTRIESSIIMGIDYYEEAAQITENARQGVPPLGIGSGCFIRNAIIDKNVRIGDGVVITNKDGIEHMDAENYSIRDYIVVVPKDAVIPSGTFI
ncbi:MAG: glucose-1-phosphate adenylyltransferase [Candidatus Poribacteria bacterium]|nr:glucose-1-phosphate adenylyltransferase [Candidatus Poribacteria bacterium]